MAGEREKLAEENHSMPLALGTETRYGSIEAIAWLGERYYFCVDRHRVVTMIPAFMLEPELVICAEIGGVG